MIPSLIILEATSNFLALVGSNTPYVNIYQQEGSTFTLLPSPASLPTGAAHNAMWSYDSRFLAVAHDNAPYLAIYQTSGSMPSQGVVVNRR